MKTREGSELLKVTSRWVVELGLEPSFLCPMRWRLPSTLLPTPMGHCHPSRGLSEEEEVVQNPTTYLLGLGPDLMPGVKRLQALSNL